MAFDQSARNILKGFVSKARKLLSEEFTSQLQYDYGMDPTTGEISEIKDLSRLDDFKMETARILRDTLNHYLAYSTSDNKKEALDRIVREQAFTVLNRICALRMAEARGILIESTGSAYNSKGFQLYARLAGTALGESGNSYRCYLFSIFDEFAIDLPVLFDRYSSMGRLFPHDSVLVELLEMINETEIKSFWAEDETIGWIYQYFNSDEERGQMRDESDAPRNSRELAVRNQFFTPRYVVQFLTDNTLGRIWYEMTKGETALKENCHYLIRHPNEIFLLEGEKSPKDEQFTEDLGPEELLKLPIYIPFRPMKDPREIRMLDPACGSMHFGLYAFDLFEKIYEEAWEFEVKLGKNVFQHTDELPLQEIYPDKESFTKDIPRLILEHNIHGVDIDPRAVQIAGLSLWLRAQRSWKDKGIKLTERPQIRRSNIICAEPMPGEKDILNDFTKRLKPRVLGQLVGIIFEKMDLAGEAGSLLKIEEEIEDAISLAENEFKKEIERRRDGIQQTLFKDTIVPDQIGIFNFADLPNRTRFWITAEQKILEALKDYSEHIETVNSTEATRKHLFAEDTVKGFAFVDLFRKRFDVILMNPPFGSWSINTNNSIAHKYNSAKSNLYSAFIERARDISTNNGKIGAITSRTGFFTDKLKDWRKPIIENSLTLFCDLGSEVLDGLVETAAYVLNNKTTIQRDIISFDLLGEKNKGSTLQNCVFSLLNGDLLKLIYLTPRNEILRLPGFPFVYSLAPENLKIFNIGNTLSSYKIEAQIGLSTKNDFRFLRLNWEIPPNDIGVNNRYRFFAKGGEFSRYWSSIHLLIDWNEQGKMLHEALLQKYPYLHGNTSWILHPESRYLRPALTYTRRTSKPISVRVLPKNCMFSDMGRGIVSFNDDIKSLAKLLAVLNSTSFWNILAPCLAAGDQAARTYEGGLINSMPFLLEKIKDEDASSVYELINKCIKLASLDETDPLFVVPWISREGNNSDMDKLLDSIKYLDKKIDKTISDRYQTSTNNLRSHPDWIGKLHNSTKVLEYLFGLIFARWDIRYATCENESSTCSDPFDSLPICPPGMLQNDKGLPAKQKDIPDDYPLRLTWDGILADDEGHPEDIIRRVRKAIEVIWEDQSGDVEQEMCRVLDVSDLREYIRKPTKFFADHLKRYSKSRRQAPIYWPLSTQSGSYTLWIYYHRLTDQTLYSCVNNFVDPKLRQISEATNNLRRKSERSSSEENELDRLIEFELEMKDFHDELLRIAKFWKPNLNDGVQITAAPLWNLFQHKPWKKTLNETWKELEAGDYDWAYLAYSIWPKRVRDKCKNDKSLAIAHYLEDIHERL